MIAKYLSRGLAALALTLIAAGSASAQNQTVNFQVQAINQFSITSTPVTLNITTAVAGSEPTPVTDATSVWSVTTNQTGAKISASIPSAMPTGVTLSVALAAPGGATSAGAVDLGVTATDLVTGITRRRGSGLAVTYTLSATVDAGVVTSANRVVTYTLTPGT